MGTDPMRQALPPPWIVDPALLPGEDPDEYEALGAEICAELQPEGALERFTVLQIVDRQWEIQRLRKIRQSVVARWQAGNMLEVMENSGSEEDKPSELLPREQMQTSVAIHKVGEQMPPKPTQEERVALASAMMHTNPSVQQKAMADFERRERLSSDQMLAAAYTDAPGVALLDRRIDMAGRSYREALKEFRMLRERPLRSSH